MTFFVRAKQPRPVYVAGRKFAHGGKGQELTEAEFRAFYATKAPDNKAIDIVKLNIESGALEVLGDDGKVIPFADLEVLFAPEAPQG